MVWSQEDFVREVRRQIVELETLRRKIMDDEDVSESLEKLEESQLYLLRKLGGLSKAAPASAEEESVSSQAPGEESTASSSSGGPSALQALGKLFQALLSKPALLESLSSQLGSATDSCGVLVLLGIDAGNALRARETPDGPAKPYSLN